MLENHGLNSVIGDPSAPYITSLAQYLRRGDGLLRGHPPERAELRGDDLRLELGHQQRQSGQHLRPHQPRRRAEANHISWGAYMEALPAAGSTVSFWPSSGNPLYASKHNPFVLFSDILASPSRLANVKPYTSLAGDLNSPKAPRFVFITPDQCNDMHGGVYGAVPGYAETPCPYSNTLGDAFDEQLKANADAFVKTAVNTITTSRAWTRHSAIFIVADEGDYTGVTQNGGWDSPAGCCDSPILPAGDPDINAAWPGGLYGGALGARDRHRSERAASLRQQRRVQPLLAAANDRGRLGPAELGFTSDHVQVHTMNEFLGH